MGAAAGCEPCIANVVRISLRYGNMGDTGKRLRHQPAPAGFVCAGNLQGRPVRGLHAQGTAQQQFQPAGNPPDGADAESHRRHQFKLEAQVIRRRPHYQIDRLLLRKIGYARGVITLKGVEYPLIDTFIPDHQSG